jgi:hypothetical protein
MRPPLLAVRTLARVAACAALLAYSGCEQAGGTTGTGGGTPTSSEGGSGGAGGDTGLTTTSSTTTTTAAPLTCAVPVTKPVIPKGECDLLQQDCPPGETCIPTMDGASTICRIGGGLKGAGKACTLNEECQAGLFCVGFCTQPCCQQNDQPCGGGDCNIELGLPGGVTLFTCSYSEECTLFGADTCKNGQKCQFVYPNQGQAVCTIPAASPAQEGEPCVYINECGSMQICFGGFCRYNCKLNGGGTPGTGGCPAGQACQDVLPPGAGGVGVCQ